MSLIRSAILIAVGLGVLGIDAAESWRTSSISDGSVHAQPHHRRRHHRRHHRRHGHRRAAPATEL
jgi:hypothetical protein